MKAFSFKQVVNEGCNGVVIALRLLLLLDSAFLFRLVRLCYPVYYYVDITIFTRAMRRTMEKDWKGLPYVSK